MPSASRAWSCFFSAAARSRATAPTARGKVSWMRAGAPSPLSTLHPAASELPSALRPLSVSKRATASRTDRCFCPRGCDGDGEASGRCSSPCHLPNICCCCCCCCSDVREVSCSVVNDVSGIDRGLPAIGRAAGGDAVHSAASCQSGCVNVGPGDVGRKPMSSDESVASSGWRGSSHHPPSDLLTCGRGCHPRRSCSIAYSSARVLCRAS